MILNPVVHSQWGIWDGTGRPQKKQKSFKYYQTWVHYLFYHFLAM